MKKTQNALKSLKNVLIQSTLSNSNSLVPRLPLPWQSGDFATPLPLTVT